MNIDKILKELTLEEKASLCSGSDFWHTEEIKRLDIPSISCLQLSARLLARSVRLRTFPLYLALAVT